MFIKNLNNLLGRSSFDHRYIEMLSTYFILLIGLSKLNFFLIRTIISSYETTLNISIKVDIFFIYKLFANFYNQFKWDNDYKEKTYFIFKVYLFLYIILIICFKGCYVMCQSRKLFLDFEEETVMKEKI